MQVTVSDLLGKPFANGGRGPDSFDCWGLAIEVFRRFGIALPDYKISCKNASRINNEINDQRKDWFKCNNVDDYVPVLIVIRFNEVLFCNHTGVYLGCGRFIHTREKAGVNIDRIDSPAWRRKIEGFYVPRWVNYEEYNNNNY